MFLQIFKDIIGDTDQGLVSYTRRFLAWGGMLGKNQVHPKMDRVPRRSILERTDWVGRKAKRMNMSIKSR